MKNIRSARPEGVIIKTIMKLPVDISEFCFFKGNGVVGLDINVDHLAISETDEHGNLIGTWVLPMKLYKKTGNQRKDIIRNTVKKVFDICEEKHKPLIIEKLDFSKKKQALKYDYKKYNRMISEFAYAQITDSIYSRSYKTKIGVKEVNPAYTSRIGKLKYTPCAPGGRENKRNQYSFCCSIPLCAPSVCIARRGQGFKEKMLKEYNMLLNNSQKKKHHWNKWDTVSKRLDKVEKKYILYNPIMRLIELEGVHA